MPDIRKLGGSEKMTLEGGRIRFGFICDGQDVSGSFPMEREIRGKRHGVPQADIVAYIAENSQMPVGAFERFLEAHYKDVPGCRVRAHCFSMEPLRLAWCVEDEGAETKENWWERP